LVRAEAVVVPAAHSIRDAERPVQQEVSVLALVGRLAYPMCALDEDERCPCRLVILRLVFLVTVLVEEGDLGRGGISVVLGLLCLSMSRCIWNLQALLGGFRRTISGNSRAWGWL